MVLVTNKAIVDAVLGSTPRSVLDVGCGDGWLVRELAKAGIDAMSEGRRAVRLLPSGKVNESTIMV